MQQPGVTAIQAIQAILAPAVGISAVGLLLLALSNRYSIMVNRIRLLNDERRRFAKQLSQKGELDYVENARFMSITKQTGELMQRSWYVRNAILAMQVAAGMFVLTSCFIGLNLFVSSDFLQALPLLIFMTGMLSVLLGIVFAALEIHRSYKIVVIEVKAEE